ncbi:MAG: hypothetical protein ABWY27_13285 [Telluria sp.]
MRAFSVEIFTGGEVGDFATWARLLNWRICWFSMALASTMLRATGTFGIGWARFWAVITNVCKPFRTPGSCAILLRHPRRGEATDRQHGGRKRN